MVVVELYTALKSAGVDDATASAAAKAVTPTELVATKADLAVVRQDLAEMRSSLIIWIVSLLVAQTGVIVGILNLLLRR